MGDVFRAHDDRLGRDVAVKVLKAAAATDPDRLRRFEQEARAAAVLNHPNIVAVYDIGMHEGTPYIVSELLEGQTLRQRLLQGPLQLRVVTDYARQLADGLMAAHERHIVHRDLKPENVLITRDGHVKILDFGIAKLTSGEDARLKATGTGQIFGTPFYMSPEQTKGEIDKICPQSDIWALGIMAHRLLFWQQKRENIEGLLYWDTTWWNPASTQNPWADMATVKDINPNIHGDGAILYPGKQVGVDGPVSSIRLEMIRDGLEDFDYLTLVDARLGKDVTRGFLAKMAHKLTDFEQDPLALERVRPPTRRLA